VRASATFSWRFQTYPAKFQTDPAKKETLKFAGQVHPAKKEAWIFAGQVHPAKKEAWNFSGQVHPAKKEAWNFCGQVHPAIKKLGFLPDRLGIFTARLILKRDRFEIAKKKLRGAGNKSGILGVKKPVCRARHAAMNAQVN
jgi:hypothetical protein